jgi:hypothetical protein
MRRLHISQDFLDQDFSMIATNNTWRVSADLSYSANI